MYAIVSLLDDAHYNLVLDLWRELEVDCGLSGVSLTPLPHLSWHIAADYQSEQLLESLQKLAGQTSPFIVNTSGIGIFTGESPVIFIPVVKESVLATFHRLVWESIQPAALDASSHYSPEAWVPHITLAHGDVDSPKLVCAMKKLAFRRFNWKIRIDHLALVYQLSGQVGELRDKLMFVGK
jgi:2'-5' RNA ligase